MEYIANIPTLKISGRYTESEVIELCKNHNLGVWNDSMGYTENISSYIQTKFDIFQSNVDYIELVPFDYNGESF